MVLWILLAHFGFRLRGFHSLRPGFPSRSTNLRDTRYSPNPNGIATIGLASSAFARHYSRNLGWFLFLRVLRCFSSPGSLRNAMDSRYAPWLFTMGVSPFGNPRIEAYLQLPVAYRSLSRPSSAPDAKAFTVRSYSLELSIDRFLPILLFSELLEFHKTNNLIRLLILFCEKVLSFCSLNCFPPFGEIVFTLIFGKTKFLIIANLVKILSSKSVRFYS